MENTPNTPTESLDLSPKLRELADFCTASNPDTSFPPDFYEQCITALNELFPNLTQGQAIGIRRMQRILTLALVSVNAPELALHMVDLHKTNPTVLGSTSGVLLSALFAEAKDATAYKIQSIQQSPADMPSIIAQMERAILSRK